MPQYLTGPTNKILYRGDPDDCILEFEVGPNADESEMVPGRIVKWDETSGFDGKVEEAENGCHIALGVLEVGVTYPAAGSSPMKVTDNYSVGDPCNVIYKMGCIVLLTLLSGGTAVTPGLGLSCAADGKAKLSTTLETVVAIAMQSVNPATDNEPCLAIWINNRSGGTS